MYASVPMLAYGIQPYNNEILYIILLTILTMYAGFFAALIWNDITDAEIDAVAHPDRPIPSGRISKSKFFAIALLFSAMTFLFSILLSILCFLIVCIAALFVAFHDKYLKKLIKIPAYSEIFTPVQWVVVAIFGYFAVWTVIPQSFDFIFIFPILGKFSTDTYQILNLLILILFTYFADNAHDLPEGIHDVEGDRSLGVKTYATSFGEKNAARISFFMFLISGFLGIILYFRTSLTYIFLIPFLIIWIYTLSFSYKLLGKNIEGMRDYGKIVGRKGFNYLLFSFNLIFLDLLIQLIYNSYL
jgi:geranylgeranylglycerol-phosphate geranylgeranyltransferase